MIRRAADQESAPILMSPRTLVTKLDLFTIEIECLKSHYSDFNITAGLALMTFQI